MDRVGIFWDYENCHPPSSLTGYAVVGKLRKAVQALGCVSVFKAYMDVSLENATKRHLQSELQSSGVSLIHCPHNSRKEVTDKMLLVDLLIFALEGRGPATIVLITGDRDFTYAISVLRMRGHEVIVISPPGSTHHSIRYLVDGMLDWRSDILECEDPSVKIRMVIANRVLSAPRLPANGQVSPPRAEEELEPTAGHNLLSSVAPICVVPSAKPETERDRDDLCSNSHSSRRSSISSYSLLSLAGHEQTPDRRMSSVRLPNLTSPTSRWAEEVNGQWSKSPTWSPFCGEMDTSDDAKFVSNAVDSPPISVFDDLANPWILTDGEGRCVSEDDEAPVSTCPSSRADLCQAEGSEVLDSNGKPYSLHLGARAPRHASVEQMDVDMPKYEDVLQSQLLKSDRGTGLSKLSYQPSGTAEKFSTLINVLMAERALGRLSTSYELLGKLLINVNPYVYKQAGVDGLKDYLELARGENIISFSDSDWTNELGWITLCSQQVYSFQSVASPISSHVNAKFEPLVRILQSWGAWGGGCTQVPFEWLSERVLSAFPEVLTNAGALNFRHYIGLAASARVVKVALPGFEWVELISVYEGTHVSAPVPPVASPKKASALSADAPKKVPALPVAAPEKKVAVSPILSQQEASSVPSVAPQAAIKQAIDSRFTILVEVLRTMRLQGYRRANRCDLSQDLMKRDPLVYQRAGVKKLKSYLTLAQKAGVIVFNKPSGPVALHPTLC